MGSAACRHATGSMAKTTANIADLALLAGVSKSTASRPLSP